MTRQTRRQFLQTSSVGLASSFAAPAILSARSPNETVRVGGAGVGGKGWTDINGAAAHANVVAFCDVDTGKNRKGGYGAAAEKWSSAKGYVDFRDIPLVSSSFADEVFGKLFVELGPIAFMQAFEIVNAAPTVSQLIDRAIGQRMKDPT